VSYHELLYNIFIDETYGKAPGEIRTALRDYEQLRAQNGDMGPTVTYMTHSAYQLAPHEERLSTITYTPPSASVVTPVEITKEPTYNSTHPRRARVCMRKHRPCRSNRLV